MRKHFPRLKAAYENVVMTDVTSLDLYRTNGAAAGASFKLTFDEGPNIYIYSDGQYWGGSELVKPIVDKWISSVKAFLDPDP